MGIVTLMLALALPVQAQVFRCDTAQGVVFTDTECASPAEQTELELPAAPRRVPARRPQTQTGTPKSATATERPAPRLRREPLFDAGDCARATRELDLARSAKTPDATAVRAFDDVRKLKCSTAERAEDVDKQDCERVVRQYLVTATARIKRDRTEVGRLRSSMTAACRATAGR